MAASDGAGERAGTRDAWRGRIRVMRHIECAGCPTWDEMGGTDGRLWFYGQGWRLRGGLWYCPKCAGGASDADD